MANSKHIRNARQGGDVRAEIEEGLDEAADPGAEPVEFCPDCGEVEHCRCLEDEELWRADLERSLDDCLGADLDEDDPDDYYTESDWYIDGWFELDY